jgi:hypothetical protein
MVVALAIALAAAAAVPGFAGAVQVTGSLATDFYSGPSAQQIIDSFSIGGQPVFWGLGWAVIPGRVGIEGDYLVSFLRDAAQGWWLDWYAQAISMSFHPLGATRWVDPYVEVGIGCAGRVFLQRRLPPGGEPLMISLFPFIAGGASLNLDGLLLGAKITYTPYASAIPVTFIPAYPLGPFQVTLSGGFSINW